MAIDVTRNWVKSFTFLGYLGNGKEVSGEIFLRCVQKNVLQ